jgi:hypothetical protein
MPAGILVNNLLHQKTVPDKYEYDIFISYRQNNNKHDGQVTEFRNITKACIEIAPEVKAFRGKKKKVDNEARPF